MKREQNRLPNKKKLHLQIKCNSWPVTSYFLVSVSPYPGATNPPSITGLGAPQQKGQKGPVKPPTTPCRSENWLLPHEGIELHAAYELVLKEHPNLKKPEAVIKNVLVSLKNVKAGRPNQHRSETEFIKRVRRLFADYPARR